MTALTWLADAFRGAGLTVVEHSGWKTRTLRPFSDYTPVGLINHHTAGSAVIPNYPDPPFYRDSALERKCNYTIRPDGVVVVLNAGWAADSGYGDRRVLDAVRNDRPAPSPTDTYDSSGRPAGSNPGLGMNRWYIDVEVQHLGNGDPINPPQREALIVSNAVVCEVMGWDPRYRVIGHRESTRRKVDPRWDGFANPMPGIRDDTIRLLEEVEEMQITPTSDKNVIRIAQKALGSPTTGRWDTDLRNAVKARLGPHTNDPEVEEGNIIRGLSFLELLQIIARDANAGKTWTRKQIAAIAATAGGAAGVTVDQVFEAIRNALG